MKNQKKLSREEMKNVLGGVKPLKVPTCANEGQPCPCTAGCTCQTIDFGDGSSFQGCLA